MCTGAEIFAIAGVAQGIGGFIQGEGVAGQYEDRAGEILDSAKQSMRQTAKKQDRRIGTIRAAYAKGGVKQTGTAKTFTEEQIAQDELELATMKYNAKLSVSEQFQSAKEARMQGLSSLIQGGVKAYGGFSG